MLGKGKRLASCATIPDYGSAKSPKVSAAIDDPSLACSRMKVCVRIRPLTSSESGSKTTVDVIDQNMLVFDPLVYEEEKSTYSYHGKIYKEIGKRSNKNLQFHFDRVFDDSESNLSIYQETTKELVTSLLDGYNCSVFAYGSTGSGKTYTMLGGNNDPGIIFFTSMDLYKKLDEENKNMELSISYFEIYNEIIYDLLDTTSRKPLSVYEDSQKGISVKNLSIHQPRDAEHLIEMLEFGNKNRKQHPTDSNAESSRSHAIFQVTLRRKDYSAENEMSIQVSKMSLIDLAGSERATNAYKSCRSQSLHREGGNINQSLLALGNCINALAQSSESQAKSSKALPMYIPYRSSKLTLILRDSLGGNCRTLMIATASPSVSHYEETHNTLLYAERAKGVQLSVRKNTVAIAIQPRDYKPMLEKLIMEKAKLQHAYNELQAKYEKTLQSGPIEPIKSSSDAVAQLNATKNTLDGLFEQRLSLRANLLECEHNLKKIDLLLKFKKQDIDTLKVLNAHLDTEELKILNKLHSLYSQQLHYSDLHKKLLAEVEENEENISRFEKDLLDATNNDIVVRSYFAENNCIAQTRDYKYAQTHHLTEILDKLAGKMNSDHERLDELFPFVYRAYNVLKVQNLLTDNMDEIYRKFVQKLEGRQTVAWPDHIESPKVKQSEDLVKISLLPVYMNSISTPAEKYNLVGVRDISPIQRNHKQTAGDGGGGGSFARNVSQHQQTNLGATVTKSRNGSNFPSSQRNKFGKENFNNNIGGGGGYSRARTPNRNFNSRGYFGNGSSNGAKIGWNSSARTHYNTSGNGHAFQNFSIPNINSSSAIQAPRTPRRQFSYGYNPNFRQKTHF